MGNGTGLIEDSTGQAILGALGVSPPKGGPGTGLMRDATGQAIAAAIAGGGGGQISVLTLGVVGDGTQIQDGHMVAGGHDLTTLGSTPFLPSSVGKSVVVADAGGAGIALVTTIATFVSSSHVTTTAAAAANTVATGSAATWGTDDSVAAQAAVNAIAAMGQWALFPPLIYLFIAQNVTLPRGALLTGYGARIVTGVGVGSVVANTIFTTTDPRFTPTRSVALQANVAQGASTVHVTSLTGGASTIARGSLIFLRLNTRYAGAQYTVIADPTGGAGNFVLTLDRPTQYAYTTVNSTVEILSGKIDGIVVNGFHFSGYAEQYFELLLAYGAVVEDCTFDTSAAPLGAVVGFSITSDTGCYRTTLRNLSVYGGNTANSGGIGFEQNEGSLGDHLFVEDTVGTSGAILLYNCADTHLRDCSCSNPGSGGILHGSNGSSPGCLGCTVRGGTVAGATGAGYDVGWGSTGVSYFGCVANDCVNGFELDAISGPTSNVSYEGCYANRASQRGFYILGGAGNPIENVSYLGCSALNGATDGWDFDSTAGTISDVILTGCASIGNGGNGLENSNATGLSGLRILGCTFGTNTQNDWNLLHTAVRSKSNRFLGGSGVNAVISIINSPAGLRNTLEDLDITYSGAGLSGTVVYLLNAGPTDVSGQMNCVAATNYGIVLDNGGTFTQLELHNLKITASSTINGGVGVLNGSTVRVGDAVDMDGITTAIALLGTGLSNIFAFPAAGGALTFNFPIKTTETVIAEKDVAGGSGLAPVITKTAGTSFTATPAAADTSTWRLTVR